MLAGKLSTKTNLIPVSASEHGCTGTTNFGNVIFNENRDSQMSLTDTIGFDDPKRETDALIISDLVISSPFWHRNTNARRQQILEM